VTLAPHFFQVPKVNRLSTCIAAQKPRSSRMSLIQCSQRALASGLPCNARLMGSHAPWDPCLCQSVSCGRSQWLLEHVQQATEATNAAPIHFDVCFSSEIHLCISDAVQLLCQEGCHSLCSSQCSRKQWHDCFSSLSSI
jgi:hypothetical protein